MTSKAYYKNRRKSLLRHLGGKCSQCGAKRKLEIHHLNGREVPHGAWYNIVDASRNLSPTIVVCAKCHAKIHGGRYW